MGQQMKQVRDNAIQPVRFVLGCLMALLIAAGSAVFVNAAYAAAPVEINQSLQDGSYVKGTISLKTSVSGLDPDSYEMFWSVENGSWVRMNQPAGSNQASAEINVDGWHWRTDNNYKLSFIALQKSTWQPVSKDIMIHVGNAPFTAAVSSAMPAADSLPVQTTQTDTSKQLYADPTDSVAVQARAWAKAHPADSKGMNYLANQPIASWFGGWNANVQDATRTYVSAATAAGKVPTLVAYNIPHRDCSGSYSGGGVADAAAYNNWISQFAGGIGNRQAIVILEPDALADIDCLSSSDQVARLQMLSSAVTLLKTKTQASVYIDAGHAGWRAPNDMAARLTAANIDQADGFSLNVSNFETTKNSISYGTAISKAVKSKPHFVIDTSRNGSGPSPDYAWCNPAGRSFGPSPTLQAAQESGNDLVDAYLWVKAPGASDGACGPTEAATAAPAAGVWWPQYAQQMLLNSDF